MSKEKLQKYPDDSGREIADLPSLCIQAHAANLMVLHDGVLACVWFGGSMEGKSDISIYMSTLDSQSDSWSTPVQLSNDKERSEQNPILFPAPNGDLWLLHTAQESGNQDTAIIRRRISQDNGKSWSSTESIEGLPLGTFVRHPIHIHSDGAWLLPVFDCKILPGEKWDGSFDESAVLRSVDQGKSWKRIAIPNSVGCVHMSIVPATNNRLLGFFRSRWADFIYTTESIDGGLSWSSPVPTVLPNNNSSIQALRLQDGRLAMIFNESSSLNATERRASLYDELEDSGGANEHPQAASSGDHRRAFWGAPRAPMTLAISDDDGKTWSFRRNLEVGDGYCMSNDSARGLNREYSYPSLRQTPDGVLHLAYTVFRKHIRHVRLSPEWFGANSKR
jgi:predicted neuraminidase